MERSGSHRDEFDVKARAMMPLADAARVLSLELGVREVGTAERFRAIAKREDGLADPCESAAAAYETLMQVRTRQGFRGGAGGRFLDIQELSSFDRQRLRQSFSALDRMQRLLTVRYQTDAIR
ncbi:MAG: putative nucleotidyltransferase substrate binding domain-containing protein [Myxococcota bacterium]